MADGTWLQALRSEMGLPTMRSRDSYCAGQPMKTIFDICLPRADGGDMERADAAGAPEVIEAYRKSRDDQAAQQVGMWAEVTA
jgi:hypothetical protein